MMEDAYGGGDQVTPTQICPSHPIAEVNQPELYIRMLSFLTFVPSQRNHFPQDDHQLILVENDFFSFVDGNGLPLK